MDVCAVAISDAEQRAPITARAQVIDEFQQRQLPFEADHAVELRHQLQRARIAEAGEMAAHGEVATHAAVTQEANEFAEIEDVRLENQREPNQHRIEVARRFQYLPWVRFKIENFHAIAVLPHG